MAAYIQPGSADEAVALQRKLRGMVVLENAFSRLGTIAGVDVSHDRAGMSHAAAVLVDAETLRPLGSVRVSMPTPFPYVPGLLSFREIPVILEALARLKARPDLLMVDGQGVAHPRRLGIAAHLGVVTGLPAVGVAKSRLTGHYKEPGRKKGACAPLMSGGERIGTVLRSKEGCLPLFISPGHGIDHARALDVTLKCLTRYRLPEPVRLADRLSKNIVEPGRPAAVGR